MFFHEFTEQLIIVITFGIGAVLIALFPLLKRENQYFAWFSMISGILVWLLLLNTIAKINNTI
ncbi:hypothetical protein ACSVDA_24315 [Cytobacillus sp. Hm23]